VPIVLIRYRVLITRTELKARVKYLSLRVIVIVTASR